ncbi:MAG: endonuclease/exonuclease/phosphatase family protein [Verrucomicrobiota bacterium]
MPALLLLTCLVQAADPEHYTFCSYNIRNWLKMERYQDGQTSSTAGKPEEEKRRVVEILVKIHPDVLGVCEVGSDEDAQDLQRRLKKAGIDLPHMERGHGGDPTRSLALFSRFPILVRNSRTDLNYKLGEQTFPMQRGILDATVELNPDLQVRFLGVHLKSMREVDEGDQALMRRNEAHLLRNHIDKILAQNTQTRIVCYGDFNEHRNEPSISAIIGSRASDTYMTDLLLRDVNDQVWTHFWDAADSYSRLDYVFTSRAMRPFIDLRNCRIHHERDFNIASDHRPLVIRIKDRL